MADIADNGAFNAQLANISSQNYGPTATANQGLVGAQTQLASQQAQQAAMQTQIQRATMPLIQQALSEASADQSSANAGNPNAGMGTKQGPGPGGDFSQTADSSGSDAFSYPDQAAGYIEDRLRGQNYVPPYTPQEMKALQLAKTIGIADPQRGKSMFDMMDSQRKARIEMQTAQNQQKMGDLYDTTAAVHNADPDGATPGQTYAMLAQADPPDAATIAKQVAKESGKAFDPKDTAMLTRADDLAREYSGHVAAVSHLYSGRPTHDKDGQLVDDRTNQPVAGQEHLYTGSTSEQLAKDREWAMSDVEVPLTTGGTVKMPRWQAPAKYNGMTANGKPVDGGVMTPDQWAAQQDRVRRGLPVGMRTDGGGPPVATPTPNATAMARSGITATQPGTPATTPAGNRNKPPAGPAADIASDNRHTAAQLPTPAELGPPPPTGTTAYNTRMSQALSDPNYAAKFNPDNVKVAVGLPQPGLQEGMQKFTQQRTELTQSASEMAKSAGAALQNFNAAKALLANPSGPITGIPGNVLQWLSAQGIHTDTATQRAEAAKYLVNGAVSGLKDTYGGRPGVFDVKINVEQAFPNIDKMGISEVRNLIDSQITQAQYLRDSANRATAYAQRGLEPGNFGEWNEHYFSRQNLVTPNQGPQPDIKKADYDKLQNGEKFWHGGKQYTKGEHLQ
jgi:hypothetical protein